MTNKITFTQLLLHAVIKYCLVLGAFTPSSVKGTSETLNMADNPTVNEVIKGNTKFASNLYQEVLKNNTDANLFFSPLSISTALTMTLAGARENTEVEINTVLGLENVDRKSVHSSYKNILASLGPKVSMANRLFVQEKFEVLPEFVEIMDEHYQSGCTNVDFSQPAAERTINEWVQKETKGKIKELVNSLGGNTAMVIANAIHFKSFWDKQFKKSNTKVAQFYVNEKETVNVNLMFQRNKFGLSFHESTNTEVLELQHEHGHTSMLIFLPRNGGSLTHLETQFGKDFIDEVFSKMTEVKTEVWLPAFKLEESYNLGDMLKNMGMKDLFSVSRANLSGISSANDLFASEVVHKSFIEVNEEGTEAAAATGVVLMKRSIQICPTFRADHPFMFCILERQTKSILFLGRLTKPEPVPTQMREEL